MLLFIPALVARINKKQAQNALETMESDMQSTLTVPGMTCNNCVAHVQKAVEAVDGVEVLARVGALGVGERSQLRLGGP